MQWCVQMKEITMTIRMTSAEHEALTNAWKREPGVVNKAQFVRTAINAYAGEKIFN